MAEVPLFSTQRIELLAGWLVRWLVDWLVAGSWWLVAGGRISCPSDDQLSQIEP